MRRLSTIAHLPRARRRSRVGAGLLALLCASALQVLPPTASAAEPSPSTTVAASAPATLPDVDVVKVSGLLDPILADLVVSAVDRAEANGSAALVLQLNSSGVAISDAALVSLARRLHDASVPVAIWVGPSGAKATGKVAQLLGAVPIVGVAPGSVVGRSGAEVIPADLTRPAFRAQAGQLRQATMGSDEARKAGIATLEAPVIVDLVGRLPGIPSHVEQKPTPHRVSDVRPVFSQLPVTSQLMHTVASPAAAYLLVVIGLALVLFELFTAGVGIAGIVGAGSFALGCFGLWVLPTNWAAFAVLAAAFVAYGVDVQIGVPRAWTAIASVALAGASLVLLDGMRVPWLPLGVGVFGTIVFMVWGMPAMVRTRFSTPTIGRDWLVGAQGVAAGSFSTDGEVRIDGGLWRARAREGATLAAGDPVRVVGVTGLLLSVDRVDASGGADGA